MVWCPGFENGKQGSFVYVTAAALILFYTCTTADDDHDAFVYILHYRNDVRVTLEIDGIFCVMDMSFIRLLI